MHFTGIKIVFYPKNPEFMCIFIVNCVDSCYFFVYTLITGLLSFWSDLEQIGAIRSFAEQAEDVKHWNMFRYNAIHIAL